MTKRKPKACRHCGHEFLPTRTTQRVCSIACAVAVAAEKSKRDAENAAKRERQARRLALRADRERIKTRPEHLADCQRAFNAWVRERDRGLPCISCGRMHQGQWHAGHYRTVKAHPELRFEPDNVHQQCAPCNNHLSGNLVGYRKGLLTRLGQDRLSWLEGPHEAKHYSIEEIKAMTKHYRAETRRLKTERAMHGLAA